MNIPLHDKIHPDALTSPFRQIVTAGWANQSEGSVESSVGHFALITIEPNELRELVEAVFDDDTDGEEIKPGYYLLRENSDGAATLYEYASNNLAVYAFKNLENDYSEWLKAPAFGGE